MLTSMVPFILSVIYLQAKEEVHTAAIRVPCAKIYGT